jgi:hypothetical protein
MCINSVPISQETHHIYVTKINRLMLFLETITHMKHTDTLCEQNVEDLYIKARGTCRTTGRQTVEPA